MRRLQLFEVLDQTWCPTVIRHGVTAYLEAIISRSNAYRAVLESFFVAIGESGATRVVDLCSGGGGPWLSPTWRSALAQHAGMGVYLTDKFPSDVLSARLPADPQIEAIMFSVDAADVPVGLQGFRTMFSSFHHFPDQTARAVLGDAVKSGDGFAMAEVTSRTTRAFLTILFMPVLVWILTPGMRPFRWSRVLFTYLLPIIPVVVVWVDWFHVFARAPHGN